MSTLVKRLVNLLLLLLGVAASRPAAADEHTLMRFPTLHGDRVVFEAHGNLWSVARAGGMATRLTSEPGFELMPRFSPDGKWIAFTGSYAGNRDVYVIPAGGGDARRLTFHSDVEPDAPLRWGPDNMVLTWTPDGRNIVFLSRRVAFNDWIGRPFTVPFAGGPAQLLPLDRAGLMSYSPDGQKIAYNRIFQNFRTWKRYDGGLAQDVDIYDFGTRQLTRVTDWPGTETAPMWYGHLIYFMSDHDAARRENIWSYDLDTKAFRQVTHFADYDADFPSLGDTGITFQQGGSLWVLDLPTEQLHKLDVAVPDDGVHTRLRYADAKDAIRDSDAAEQTDYALSPNGKRALLVGRGDIFSLPAEHGNTRNLTQTPGADEDHPAWSPDGKTIAYTTDAGGEQQIAVRPAGGGAERLVTHFASGYFYQPVWAPGGDHLAFSDANHRLWVLDLSGGEPRQVAQDPFTEIHDYSWSPDGRWLAYAENDANHVSQVRLYALADGKSTSVGTGRDNDAMPRFDPEGRHLYFISARHENPLLSDREMNAITVKSGGIYAVTLAADTPSLLAPRSDEGAVGSEHAPSERSAHDKPPHDPGHPAASDDAGDPDDWRPQVIAPIRIDLAGIAARVTQLPLPAGEYDALEIRKDQVFYLTRPPRLIDGTLPGDKTAVHVFGLKKRKDAVIVDDVDGYVLAANGAKLLYKKDKDFFIVDAKAGAGDKKDDDAAGDDSDSAKKQLDLSHMRVAVEPRLEWREMFLSAWRLERDLFVNPKMNGVDWPAVRAAYEKLLPLAGSREDLNYLIGEMQGELGNSHTYVGGGDQDDPTPAVPTALLGADLALDHATGRYTLARIYPGDNARASYNSPLTKPGIAVKQGDTLLAIDGRKLSADVDPYSLLVNKTDATLTLTVADAAGAGAHDVVVEPIAAELRVREQDWIDRNRALVDRLSGGRAAYIYLSDMSDLGMQQFIRQFYSQTDKQALVVDDRFNGGGFIDQILLERLRRVLVGMGTDRERVAQPTPDALIVGPKICLINHYSASDGDIFPFYFRKYGLGPLMGTRTWGGVRGIRGEWHLLDGGYITVPEASVYGLDSQWVIENKGVSPDLPLDDSPADWAAGHDVQLEAAVKYLTDQLAAHPVTARPPPPPPLPPYSPEGHE